MCVAGGMCSTELRTAKIPQTKKKTEATAARIASTWRPFFSRPNKTVRSPRWISERYETIGNRHELRNADYVLC